MQVALAALMAHGYRPDTKRPGHHVTVLQGLTLTIDLAAARVRVLDTLRRQADGKFERAQRGRAARSVAMASRPCDGWTRKVHRGSAEPANLGRSVFVGEGRPVRAFGGEPHVDVRRRQNPGAQVGGIGAQSLVVAGAVAFFVVRARDRIERCERARTAQHLIGEQRVQLHAVELRARQRTRLVPKRIGISKPPFCSRGDGA